MEGRDCSDRSSDTNDISLSFEAVLFQTNFDNPNELTELIVQSGNAAALHNSKSKTVCDQVWLDNYVHLLYEKEKINVVFLKF